jgi:CDGSH-type Zn-finger protein
MAGKPTPVAQPQVADRRRRVVITPYRDGPLVLRGPITILRPDGSAIQTRRNPLALCRCGKSRLAPFCDGTHKLVGFRSTDGLPPARIRTALASDAAGEDT